MVATDFKDGVYTISDGLVSKTVKLETPKKRELILSCDCQSELLRIDKWEDEEEYYLTVYRYSFPYISFFSRIKYAIAILCGKGIPTDIILSKKEMSKLKKFI